MAQFEEPDMEELSRDLDEPTTLGDLILKVNKLGHAYGALRKDQDGLKDRVETGFELSAKRFDKLDASLEKLAKGVPLEPASGTDASNATASAAAGTAATASVTTNSAASAAAGEWDTVHEVVADKLAPVVVEAVADDAGFAGGRAAGSVGGRSSTRLAQKKATQGGRVEKKLNPKAKKIVNELIRGWVEDGTFRKGKQYWEIRRDAWGTFVDHIRSRADLTVDENGEVNMKKKAAPRADRAPRAGPVVPSATVRSPTPPAAAPSDQGPSDA